MAGVITLLTDFGLRDSYVAQMKGVLLTINPDATIVDVTHEIEPQDVRHGAYVLGTSIGRFPPGAIHVVVVDPGVGTSRRPILVATETAVLIGPDNGVLTPALTDGGAISVYDVANPDVMGASVSRTFHGRDIFAPAAGHASLVADLSTFGPAVDDPVLLDAWQPEVGDGGVTGCVLHVDRFGNLITNIGTDLLAGRTVVRVAAGPCELGGLSETYGDVGPGEALALVGSQDTVEISVNGGSAAERFGVGREETVTVSW